MEPGERAADHSTHLRVCATRSDGRPHVAPVWGVWLDEAFYFETGQQSRKALNLKANPELVLHLDVQGDKEAIMLEETVQKITDPSTLARFAETYNPKYDWHIED